MPQLPFNLITLSALMMSWAFITTTTLTPNTIFTATHKNKIENPFSILPPFSAWNSPHSQVFWSWNASSSQQPHTLYTFSHLFFSRDSLSTMKQDFSLCNALTRYVLLARPIQTRWTNPVSSYFYYPYFTLTPHKWHAHQAEFHTLTLNGN